MSFDSDTPINEDDETVEIEWGPLQEAEYNRIEAETKKLDVEREHLSVETQRARLLLEASELALKQAHIQTEALVEDRAFDKTADFRHHVYKFVGPVSAESVVYCMRRLDAWDRMEQPGEVEIQMTSPGGDVHAGMGLMDHIREMQHRGWKFTIVARGIAASMATVILQIADKRVAGSLSTIHMHQISGDFDGRLSQQDVEDIGTSYRKIEDLCRNLFVERSGGKLTARKYNALIKRETYLSASEALALGLVDEVR